MKDLDHLVYLVSGMLGDINPSREGFAPLARFKDQHLDRGFTIQPLYNVVNLTHHCDVEYIKWGFIKRYRRHTVLFFEVDVLELHGELLSGFSSQ